MLAYWGVTTVLAACIKLTCCDCPSVSGVYVCSYYIPQSFPEGITSLLFWGVTVGELNSTVFTSDSLSSVTHLTLSGTGITAIAHGALAKFQQLEVIELNNNSLRTITPNWFSHPEVMKGINLSNNSIETIDVADLSNFSGLEVLDLSVNHIHTISLGSFIHLRNVQVLDLSNNSLTYVNPETFQPLGNATKILLHDNPWDCSCGKAGFEDFVIFLQGLRSTSQLLKDRAVTCRTPVALKGKQVWSVSCPSPHPTITGAPTEAPGTGSRATALTLTPYKPSSANTVEPVAKLAIGLPALICLIVALCILLCMVCVLSILYHRKLQKKRVVPHPEAQSPGSNLHSSFPQQGPKDPISQAIHSSKLSRGRARSAGPVMCRSEVSKATTKSLPEDNVEKGQYEYPEKTSSGDKQTHAALVTGDGTGTECVEEHSSAFQRGVERNAESPWNTEEDLPYLTIGMNPPAEHDGDHGYSNTRQTPHPGGKPHAFVRVKTWPPTAILWARQQAKPEEVVDVSFFQELQAEFRLRRLQEISDKNFQSVSLSNAPKSLLVDLPLNDTDKAGIAEGDPSLGCEAGLSTFSDETKGSHSNLLDSDHQNNAMIDTGSNSNLPDSDYQDDGMIDTGTTSKLPTSDHQNDDMIDTGSNSNLPDSDHQNDGMIDTGSNSNLPDSDHQNDDMIDTDPDQSIVDMLRLESTEDLADGKTDERLEMDATTEATKDPDQSIVTLKSTDDMANGNDDMQLGMDMVTLKTEEELQEPSAAGKRSRTGTSQSKQRPREADRINRQSSQADKSATGASGPTDSCSPGDESLLQDNEYVFIDLLHEVVENKGRWTRERWRQSHLNRRKLQLKY